MKKTIFYIVALITALWQPVYGNTEALKNANDFYATGEYAMAADAYEKIIKQQGVAPELYFNLGNAYYKMNETGKSILNYERALRLRPGYKNALINLEFAQARVVDNVIQAPSFFLKRWFTDIMKMLSSNQWFWLAFVAFIITLVFALFFVYGASHFLRRFSFYTATIMAVLMVVTLFFSGLRKNQMLHHNEAIIMTGSVTAKSSPDKSGTDLFQLHEGTKVKVKSTLGEWTEIVLGNGTPGWIQTQIIEII
ncbi:MAG: tetratricopeptide repeat protein [Paludibacteraceae bacterium]|nr:tetratricopeptide repeat protein [Paludibacteraceae bacterium]